MNIHQNIALAVLAGGRSSRMGFPKAAIEVAHRPILREILDRFRWSGPTLLITAPGREHPPGCENFDAEYVDPLPDQGPLRGILTALENAPADDVLVLPVDMPCIIPAQLQRLIDAIQSDHAALGVMMRRAEEDSRIEPFPSIYRRGAATVIADLLSRGEGAVHGLLKSGARFIAIPGLPEWDERIWTNLNRPSDLAAFLEIASKRESVHACT